MSSHLEVVVLKVQNAVCWIWELVLTEHILPFSHSRSSTTTTPYNRAGAKGFLELVIGFYHIVIKPGSGISLMEATVKVAFPAIVRRGQAL